MISRDNQIDAVVHGVAEPGAVVLVTGDEGTGKSHLVQLVADALGGDGRVVRRIRGTGTTDVVALGAFAGILGTIGAVASRNGRVGAETGPWTDAQARGEAGSRGEATEVLPALLAASLVTHLRSLGSPDSPACLVVDEGDLLDDASVQVVLHAIAGPSDEATTDVASTAITVVVVARADRPWSDGFRALAASAGTRARLAPLSRAELAALAAGLLGGPLTSAARSELWRLTEGVPLFAVELLGWWKEAGLLVATTAGIGARPGGSGGAGASSVAWELHSDGSTPLINDVVAHRLALVGPDERRLLELLAAGGELPVAVLVGAGPAPGSGSSAHPEVLDGLEQRRLVVTSRSARRLTVSLAHPIYQEAIRAGMSPLRTQARLRQLIDALAATGARRSGDGVLLASWAHAAGMPVDPEWTGVSARKLLGEFSSAFRDSGRPARANDRNERSRQRRAHELAEAAWSAEPSMGTGYALLVTLVEDVEGTEEFARVLPEVRRLAPPGMLSASLDVLESVWRFWTLGQHAEVVDLLEASAAAQSGTQALRLRCYRGNVDTQAGFIADGEVVLDSQVPRRDAHIDLRVLHGTATATNRLWAGRAEDALELVDATMPLALEVRDETALALSELALVRGDALVLLGRPDEAREEARAVAATADAVGSHSVATTFHGVVAAIALRNGDVPAAIDELEDALAVHPDRRTIDYSLRARSTLAVARVCRGEVSRAADAVDAARARLRGPRAFAFELDVAEVVVTVAQARTDHAATIARRALAVQHQRGAVVAALHLAYAATTLVDAAEFAPTLDRASSSVRGPVADAMHAHGSALVARDGRELESSADALDGVGFRLWGMLARRQAAAMHRKAGSRSATARAARMAVDGRAEGVTGLPWAEDARRAVEPAISALTRREADVVALASRGWSSPAIADELGVSVRTVESHLYRAFAKLGVSSRDDLRSVVQGS